MGWSSQQYVKFEDERTRPVRDLVGAIPSGPVRRAIDIGCGPGNSTEVLAQRFAAALITGIDSSTDMIEAARKRLPGFTFEKQDIGAWHPTERYDVILANAVLQWMPDHEHLFPRLVSYLTMGGSLAVQMPDNMDAPTHVGMREAIASGPWAAKLVHASDRADVGTAAFYYRLLKPHCARVDVWRTVYHHPLDGIEGIVDWFKGSALRPYLARLDPAEQAAFLDAYRAILAKTFQPDSSGKVLLPFPRLFIVASV